MEGSVSLLWHRELHNNKKRTQNLCELVGGGGDVIFRSAPFQWKKKHVETGNFHCTTKKCKCWDVVNIIFIAVDREITLLIFHHSIFRKLFYFKTVTVITFIE